MATFISGDKDKDVTMCPKTKTIFISGDKVKDVLPMDEKLGTLRKELETYVKVLNSRPPVMLSHTRVMLNPFSLDPREVGGKMATEIETWWRDTNTPAQFLHWMHTNNHKVNGKFGNWSAGFMGSRWADVDINGRRCRLAFYSRTNNPKMFPEDKVDKKYNYMIMIDPTN